MFAIAAMTPEGGIGKNGTIPWNKDAKDLKFFRHMTDGGSLIMGRKTYQDEAMPKPLKNRLSIVIGGLKDYDYPDSVDTLFLSKLDWEMFDNYFYNPILIGGASLYNEAIRSMKVHTFYINFNKQCDDCDTFVDLEALHRNYKGEEKYMFDMWISVYTRKN